MLINIDPSTGTVTRLDGQEESGLLKTCDRLKEELGGWLDYRKLAGKEERYGKVSPHRSSPMRSWRSVTC